MALGTLLAQGCSLENCLEAYKLRSGYVISALGLAFSRVLFQGPSGQQKKPKALVLYSFRKIYAVRH